MQQLIELYEMISLNELALSPTEQRCTAEARVALRLFEAAMQRFMMEFREAASGSEAVAGRPGSGSTAAAAV